MISITIGLFMVAGLAALVASQSSTRAEIDKSGRMIENGRYALQTLISDAQLAGYWGELSSLPATPAALPDPCSATSADILGALPLHVQGYNNLATLPANLAACLSNQLAGTDVLVVRRADTTEIPVASAVAGQTYIQTGMTASGLTFTYRLGVGGGATSFDLQNKSGALSNLRKVSVHIYYISQCSEPVGTSCAGADGGTPLPTLKRVELGATGGAAGWTTTSIAEGIENLQIDYGTDSDSDGAPDGNYVDGAAIGATGWPDVVSLKVHILAKNPEISAGYSDTKTYSLGTFGATAATNDAYKRHVFSETVRIVNPSSRRSL